MPCALLFNVLRKQFLQSGCITPPVASHMGTWQWLSLVAGIGLTSMRMAVATLELCAVRLINIKYLKMFAIWTLRDLLTCLQSLL